MIGFGDFIIGAIGYGMALWLFGRAIYIAFNTEKMARKKKMAEEDVKKAYIGAFFLSLIIAFITKILIWIG